MNTYLFIKTLHILSSVVLVGTGFGSAFYFYSALRERDVPTIMRVSRMVVRADWMFTTPTIIIQPITGFYLMALAGYAWYTPWLLATLALYMLAGACWIPVVVLQIRLRDMAQTAHKHQHPLPPAFWRMAAWWEYLGYPAFVAMVVVYGLMVMKPVLWSSG